METMKTIAKRKSTRSFLSEKQIAKADLDVILAAGSAAPVGMGDYASLHLTVIQNPALLDKLNKAVQTAFKIDRNVLYGAPTFVLVSSKEAKAPNIQYANVACVMENMLLAATDIGIDGVYIWSAAAAFANNPDLRKEFGIPDGFAPISGAALGYATQNNPAEKELKVTLAVNYIK
ncbi:MAG: nitroreductase family protein [Clostridiales bacterium]|jgi:nitroreductase|nr:nitroreductase family protein [Clostridiales bacterium]